MGSMTRKLKRAGLPPLAAPPKPLSLQDVQVLGERCVKEGYTRGFNDGYRAAVAEMLACVEYLLQNRPEIFKSKRAVSIIAESYILMNDDYYDNRTPKQLAAIASVERQGIVIEKKKVELKKEGGRYEAVAGNGQS